VLNTMPASKGRRIQNQGRVILGLVFYGTPVVIAITVGLNGYIVDMNWQLEGVRADNKGAKEILQNIAVWPEVRTLPSRESDPPPDSLGIRFSGTVARKTA
jgi:hypothetical protein